MTIQSSAEVAVQVHSGPFVNTPNDAGPPADSNEASTGSRPVTAQTAAAWVTVKTRPSTLIVPIRSLVVAFSATV